MKKVRHMLLLTLPQHKNKPRTPEHLYKLFRARVKKSSEFIQKNDGKSPKAVILNFYDPDYSTQMGVLIAPDSFQPIIKKGVEVGFQASILNRVFGIKYVLYVFGDTQRAYIEKQ